MKILVFGAGAIGSAFGGFLSRDHDVTLLGRLWHLSAIRKHGLQVHGIWGRHRFRDLRLETQAERIFQASAFFDLILVTVKSYDTAWVARFLKHRISPPSLVLSLQNGIGNIETLHRFLPKEQVLAGRVIFGVEIKPGKIKITVSADKTRIGETHSRKITKRVQFLARIFSKAGLPTEATADVQKYLWTKLIYNSALNPLASFLGVPYGFLSEYEPLRFLMNQIIHEAYLVGRRKRLKLTPQTAEGYLRLFYRKLVPSTYDHHPSMLQDLRRGKRTEIDALNGALVKLGKSLGLDTPFNQLMVSLIPGEEP